MKPSLAASVKDIINFESTRVKMLQRTLEDVKTKAEWIPPDLSIVASPIQFDSPSRASPVRASLSELDSFYKA